MESEIHHAHSANSIQTVSSLIRRYFQLYWLKPFDAVNDAANAWALLQFEWDAPILEVGGGDGVFSFVMHGGEFALTNDRYSQADPTRPSDIYDVYYKDRPLTTKRRPYLHYRVGVDLKLSHLYKSSETGLYISLVSSRPEALPLRAGLFKTVFLYTFHGLTDYRRSLEEIRRVVRPDGSLLIITFNRTVSGYFVCYPLYRYFESRGWKEPSSYFKRLDAGRYDEISGFGHTLDEWEKLFGETGFRLTDVYNQVAPLAWKVYDFQTRPFLKLLIRWNWLLEQLHLKTVIKAAWIYALLPFLLIFYAAFARPKKISIGREASDVFFAFRAVPCSSQDD